MNHIYRIVWNNVAACWQAVAETAASHGKSQSRKRAARSAVLIAGGLLCLPVWAGPTGGQVTAGSATISQSGSNTTINQSSQNAAINWRTFSVGKTESVRFNQPNAGAITLNRVTGTESSQILGSLTANGRVFILNPNGVLIGNGAQVNVGGFVGSTGKMSDADFMAGNYRITDATQGSVINQGNIAAAQGGVVALVAPVVQNTGTISARQGSVLLAGAQAVTLKLQDGSLVGYTIDQGALQALADNGGLIQAEGGHVVLTAKGLDALSKATVNHSGIIEAQTVSNKNGVVELLGDMEVGQVNVSGKIDASAPDGGDGGFIETSAARAKIADSARMDTSAPYGKTGQWLIDPNDFVIASSGGDMTGAALSASLASSNVIIESATMGTAGGNGDIFVNDAISWNASTVLSLIAERNITINRAITGRTSGAGLTLSFGSGPEISTLLFNAPVSMSRISLILSNGAGARQTSSGLLTADMLSAQGYGSVQMEQQGNSIGAVKADISDTFWLITGGRTLTVASAPFGVSGITAANIGLMTDDLILNAPLIATETGDISLGPNHTTDALCSGPCVRPHVEIDANGFVNNVGSSAISVPAGKFWSVIAASPTTTTLNGLAPDATTYDGANIRGDILLSSNRVLYRTNGSSSQPNSSGHTLSFSMATPGYEEAKIAAWSSNAYSENSKSAPNSTLDDPLDSELTRLALTAGDTFSSLYDAAMNTDPLAMYEAIDLDKVSRAKNILGAVGSIAQVAQTVKTFGSIFSDAAHGEQNLGNVTDAMVDVVGYTPAKVFTMPAELAVLAADLFNEGSVSSALANNTSIAKNYYSGFLLALDNISTKLAKGTIDISKANQEFAKEKESTIALLNELYGLNTGIQGTTVNAVLVLTGNGSSLIKFENAVNNSIGAISQTSFDMVRAVASKKLLMSIY